MSLHFKSNTKVLLPIDIHDLNLKFIQFKEDNDYPFIKVNVMSGKLELVTRISSVEQALFEDYNLIVSNTFGALLLVAESLGSPQVENLIFHTTDKYVFACPLGKYFVLFIIGHRESRFSSRKDL